MGKGGWRTGHLLSREDAVYSPMSNRYVAGKCRLKKEAVSLNFCVNSEFLNIGNQFEFLKSLCGPREICLSVFILLAVPVTDVHWLPSRMTSYFLSGQGGPCRTAADTQNKVPLCTLCRGHGNIQHLLSGALNCLQAALSQDLWFVLGIGFSAIQG